MAHQGGYSYGSQPNQGVPPNNYGASPAPPAPYGNPAYNPNSNYSQFYNAQTNQASTPYQQQHVPPPPPPSQTQPGYMNYNPGQYGLVSPAVQQAPPLPPRNQNQGVLPAQNDWTSNVSHGVTEASGKSRYNVRPSHWSQTHGQHRVYEGWHQHNYNQAPNQNQTSGGQEAAPLSPPILPPRPLSAHGYPAAPPTAPSANPASQAYFANQAYIQQSSSNAVPWGATYQASPGQQQNLAQNQTALGQGSGQSQIGSPGQSVQADSATQQSAWFNPAGSMFPQYPPPNQQSSGSQNTATSPPSQPPRPTVSPSPLQNSITPDQQTSAYAPPQPSEPVSPIESRQDSYSSIYDAPKPPNRLLQHIVSRNNSESSIPATRPGDASSQGSADASSVPTATLPPVRNPAFGGGFSDWQHFEPSSVQDLDDEESFAKKNEASISKHANAIEIMELDSTPISLPLQSAPDASHDSNRPLARAETQVGITPIIESYKDREPRQPPRTGSPTNTAVNEQVKTGSEAVQADQRAPTMDIAPALDVWYKNSLMRYLAMLYKEQAADSVEEKRKVFRGFVMEESKARGLDSEAEQNQATVSEDKKSDSQAETLHVQHNPAAIDVNAVDKAITVGGGDFSPGGRPIMQPKLKDAPDADPQNPGATATPATSANDMTASSSTSAQDEHHAAPDAKKTAGYVPFRAADSSALHNAVIGPSGSSAQQAGPGSTSKPVYTSLYKPYTPAGPDLAEKKPVDTVAQKGPQQPPKSDQQIASTRSGSVSEVQQHGRSGSVASVSSHRPEHNEIFIDGQAQPAPAQPSEPARNDTSVGTAAVSPGKATGAGSADTATASLKTLESLVFNMEQSTSLNPRLENLKTSLMLYPSDYTFVTTTFDKWKIKAAGARARAETDSRSRASENQQRIDQLYDEKQISYSDIKLLEDTFNQQEGQIRARQNEAEYESYLTDVFDPLYKRLQEEVGALTELLSDATNLAKEEGVAGADMKDLHDDNWGDKVDLAESLRVVVELHRKLEERHDQLADCIMKRDRRRRAIDEIAVDGADKLTQVDFRRKLDTVERSANVAKCEARKRRIQPLWQMVKPAAMRGIKENTALTMEITQAFEDVSVNDKFANLPNHEHLKDQLLQTLQALADSSESLAKSFACIDVDFNLAEFSAAVAQATLDNAPKAIIANLGEEKAAEDAILKTENEKRLEDVRAALKAAQAAAGKASRGKLAQAEHELRQQKALEEAKRRNAGVRSALSVQTPV